MSVKRRGFVKTLLLSPAVPAALKAQQPPANTQQPVPQPDTSARQAPRVPTNPAQLKTTEVDLTAETIQRFFTADQYAALQKLGSVLVPPIKGNPGAVEAKAPEFLDFLISVSPAIRQTTYRNGLDYLNAQAKQKFNKSFAELSAADAGAIIKPLMVVRAWPQDLPTDPIKSFIVQAHEDLRTATRNSKEWADAAATTGRRFTRGGSSGLYLAPVDPLVGD
jgi:Gluconate 2-dehydrogenase subunit 3